MSSNQEPLVIGNWQNGIGDSPYAGLGIIRNADINSFPGAVRVSKKPSSLFKSITQQTFTADAGTDICTTPDNVEVNQNNFGGTAVYFTTTGTLPAGLSPNVTYFLIKVSNNTFKVATSYKNSVGSAAGTAINITDTGSGVHTIKQVPIGTINWIIEDPRTFTQYLLGSNGRVWFSQLNSGTAYLLNNSAIDTPASGVANASGQGIVITPFTSTSQTWLFVFRNATVDVIDVFGNTTIEALGWTNGWQSLNTGAGSSNSHHAIKGQDDALYFCDDRYVGSIIENVASVFDPSNAATYTFNNQALDLPVYEVTSCLEEFDLNLLVGNSSKKIYPWDRSSVSYDRPIIVPEKAVSKMKVIGDTIYILAGTKGNIYTSQGVYAGLFRQLPIYIINEDYDYSSSPVTWGGIGESAGSLIFGVGATTTSASGLYRLYPSGVLIHEKTPSAGAKNVIGLLAKDDFYTMGYNGGADAFTSSPYTYSADGYPTLVQSGFITVGSKTKKAKYSELELKLGRTVSDAHVKISYRTDTNSNFTELYTFVLASETAKAFTQDIGLTDLEDIQIQAELVGDAELFQIVLHP